MNIPERVQARLRAAAFKDSPDRELVGQTAEVILVSKSFYHTDQKTHALLAFPDPADPNKPGRVLDIPTADIVYADSDGLPFFNTRMTSALIGTIDEEHSRRSAAVRSGEPHPWIRRIVSLGVESLIPSENPKDIHYSKTGPCSHIPRAPDSVEGFTHACLPEPVINFEQPSEQPGISGR